MLTQIGNPSTFRNLVVVVRAQVAQIEGGGLGHAPRRVLSTGWHSIDVALPGGGLVQGALHEMAGSGPDIEHGTTPAALIAGIAARACGQVIWIVERVPPHGPGLAGFGLAPDRVIYVVAGKNVLLAMEDSLRQAGLIAVVGEVSGRLGLTTSRRLQLVAEASGVIAFALRRSHVHDDPMLAEPSAAMTRWRELSYRHLQRWPELRMWQESDEAAGNLTSYAVAMALPLSGSFRDVTHRGISIRLLVWTATLLLLTRYGELPDDSPSGHLQQI